ISRLVRLCRCPKYHRESVRVTASPELEKGIARIQVRTTVVNALEKQAELSVAWTVIEEQTGREVLSPEALRTVVRAGGQEAVEFPERVLASPLLWHFD